MLDTNMMDSHPKHADPKHNICGQMHNPPGASCSATGGPKNLDDCFKFMWEPWLQFGESRLVLGVLMLLEAQRGMAVSESASSSAPHWASLGFESDFAPQDVWRDEQKWTEKKLESSTADWQIDAPTCLVSRERKTAQREQRDVHSVLAPSSDARSP